MKKLIFILLLFKGCVAFGQVDLHWYGDTTTYLQWFKEIFPDAETTAIIPRLMLVTDTTHCYEDTKVIDSMIDTEKLLQVITFHIERLDKGICDNSVYTIVGYEVKEIYKVLLSDIGEHGIMQHKEYLDADKKPLPKNVVVWLAK